MSFLCINRHLNRLVQRFPVDFIQVYDLVLVAVAVEWELNNGYDSDTGSFFDIFYRPINGQCAN